MFVQAPQDRRNNLGDIVPLAGPARATSRTDEIRMRVLEQLPGVTIIQHVEDSGIVWATRRRTIIKRNDHGPWQVVTRFPFCWPRDAFAWSRPTARMARADKANLYVNRHGGVLAIRGGSVYRLEGRHLQRLGAIQGDCVLHRGICEDDDGYCYFGEYFMNPNRGSVRVWRCDPRIAQLQVAWEFSAQSIRHVHGIYRDPFHPTALWLTTGDYQGECHLYRTEDGFRSLERIGDGGQLWRAVALLFTHDHVNWITDSHIEQNYACRLNRGTGRLEVGQAVPCSGWYGTTLTDDLHVYCTTVERGPAIQRDQCSVLTSRDGFHWTEAGHFRKDAWRPLRVFKYGVLSLPSGSMSSRNVYLSGEGVRGLDGSSVRIALERREEPAK